MNWRKLRSPSAPPSSLDCALGRKPWPLHSPPETLRHLNLGFGNWLSPLSQTATCGHLRQSPLPETLCCTPHKRLLPRHRKIQQHTRGRPSPEAMPHSRNGQRRLEATAVATTEDHRSAARVATSQPLGGDAIQTRSTHTRQARRWPASVHLTVRLLHNTPFPNQRVNPLSCSQGVPHLFHQPLHVSRLRETPIPHKTPPPARGGPTTIESTGVVARLRFRTV